MFLCMDKSNKEVAVKLRAGVICLHVSIATALLAVADHGMAADIHVTPNGAGKKDGSAWTNALAQEALNDVLAKVKPGDRVMLGSGRYGFRRRGSNVLFQVARGGTADKPITITGVDTGGGEPIIAGKWKAPNPRYHAHSWAAIDIQPGVSHLTLRGLRIEGFMHGVMTRGEHQGLSLESLHIEITREAVLLQGVSSSRVSDCQITRYTKKGVNFEKACRAIQVEGVTVDATGGVKDWPTEEFPFGFAVADEPSNRDIHYKRCVAKNNLHVGKPNTYFNGDGFLAEGAAEGIRYEDCIAMDNSDGGWDDKSRGAVLINCIAVRNKRNFRLWNSRGDKATPSRLTNCVGAFSVKHGGRSNYVGLWVSGHVIAERCTFHGNISAAVSASQGKRESSLTLKRCLLTASSAEDKRPLTQKERGASLALEQCVQWPGDKAEPPRYRDAKPDWSGKLLDAFVSETYADRAGYRVPQDGGAKAGKP